MVVLLSLILGGLFINNLGVNKNTGNGVGCTRTEPYPIPEEFKRSVSLIIQRQGQNQHQQIKDYSQLVDKYINCLNIQYYTDGTELENADGYFKFDRNSSVNNLQIFVSPKYTTKDDLLTALLLQHEISHAIYQAQGLAQNNAESCFIDEARAFSSQAALLGSFNEEERNSLVARSRTSKNVASFFAMMMPFSVNPKQDRTKNAFDEANTIMVVKGIPEYVNQCSNRYN